VKQLWGRFSALLKDNNCFVYLQKENLLLNVTIWQNVEFLADADNIGLFKTFSHSPHVPVAQKKPPCVSFIVVRLSDPGGLMAQSVLRFMMEDNMQYEICPASPSLPPRALPSLL